MPDFLSYLVNGSSPIVVSVPHAGLEIPSIVPPERVGIKKLKKEVFFRDVDYEIQKMWEEPCRKLKISLLKAHVHRYVLDLNRRADDYDQESVEGAQHPKGTHPKGIFWTKSTLGENLSSLSDPPLKPMSLKAAGTLIEKIWKPYYDTLENELKKIKNEFGFAILVDGHSMPSRGSALHDDKGKLRADIVPSDFDGKSCPESILNAAIKAAKSWGLSCTPNNPYKGGGITQHFGRPLEKYFAIQIEANRALYMNEETKVLKDFSKLKDFAGSFLQALLKLRFEG